MFGLLSFHTVAVGQLLEIDLHRLVGVHEWSPEEESSLEKGEVVVRSLETKEKLELASIGILRIRELPPISMDKFRQCLSQKTSDAKKAGRRFSNRKARQLHDPCYRSG